MRGFPRGSDLLGRAYLDPFSILSRQVSSEGLPTSAGYKFLMQLDIYEMIDPQLGSIHKVPTCWGRGGCRRNGLFLRTIVLIGCVKSVLEGEGVQIPKILRTYLMDAPLRDTNSTLFLFLIIFPPRMPQFFGLIIE